MSFPQSFLDDLRARVGLADIVGTSVKLIKRGREYSGLVHSIPKNPRLSRSTSRRAFITALAVARMAT